MTATPNDILSIINEFNLSDKLELVEKILKGIRKDSNNTDKEVTNLGAMFGIWKEDTEADEIAKFIEEECGKIDHNEW